MRSKSQVYEAKVERSIRHRILGTSYVVGSNGDATRMHRFHVTVQKKIASAYLTAGDAGREWRLMWILIAMTVASVGHRVSIGATISQSWKRAAAFTFSRSDPSLWRWKWHQPRLLCCCVHSVVYTLTADHLFATTHHAQLHHQL